MRVTHVLSNGTKLEDITGHVVKKEEAETVYDLIDHINREGIYDAEKNKKQGS